MNQITNKRHIESLREGFEVAYPEYAKLLNGAKSETDLRKAYKKVYKDAMDKAKPYLSDAEAATGCPSIALTPSQYASLIGASGGDIEVQVTALLKTAQIIKAEWSAEHTAAQFIMGGITAITAVGVGAFYTAIGSGVVLAAATLVGVEAVTVAGIVAVVAAVIVAIIVPILYFMLKPASCFVVVINETSGDLSWVDDYNVHGKPVVRTDSVKQAVSFGTDKYVACGIIQTDKHDNALVGTQYGFTYKANNGNVSFGVECPLTSIYVDNNCYCAINSTSKSAAEETDSKNELNYSASIDNPKLDASIACNSGSGYVAYYVARVKDGSLSSN